MVTIRRYQQSDAPALWTVYFSAIREIAAADYTAEQIAAWAPAALDSSRWAVRMRSIAPFVAERDGTIVGYADLQSNGYIDHFFVAGSAMRQGVGSRLMAEIHATARSSRLESLFADVSRYSASIFRTLGFRRRTSADRDRSGGRVEELPYAQEPRAARLGPRGRQRLWVRGGPGRPEPGTGTRKKDRQGGALTVL